MIAFMDLWLFTSNVVLWFVYIISLLDSRGFLILFIYNGLYLSHRFLYLTVILYSKIQVSLGHQVQFWLMYHIEIVPIGSILTALDSLTSELVSV
jgi:hypothetical protein